MRYARIAVIVAMASFTASSAKLTAQQDVGGHLTIEVTDITGAPIPKAQVNIMSPQDGRLLAFTADDRGIATLNLKPGEYQYRVAYPGFCPKNDYTTIDTLWSQEIRARLQVDGCPGPCARSCVTPIGVEPSGYPVTIEVIDPTGAVIPGAQVEIDPYASDAHSIRTDGNGQAYIGILAGLHSLRVSARGFANWKGFAEVQGTEEVITAKLRIPMMEYPVVVIESPGVDVHLYVGQLEPIALQPLETLPLPGVPLRKHNRHH